MVERIAFRGSYCFVVLTFIASLAYFVAPVAAAGGPAAAPPGPTTAPADGRAGEGEQDSPSWSSVSGSVVDDRTGAPITEFAVTWGDQRSIAYWQHSDDQWFTGGKFGYQFQEPPYFSGDYRV